MRKIEKEMRAAVYGWHDMKSGNTQVKCSDKEVCVYLHGHKIFSIERGQYYDIIKFTLAGWNTNTTRSRLRALGVGVWQKDYTPMWDEKPIDSREWYEIIDPK